MTLAVTLEGVVAWVGVTLSQFPPLVVLTTAANDCEAPVVDCTLMACEAGVAAPLVLKVSEDGVAESPLVPLEVLETSKFTGRVWVIPLVVKTRLPV